MRWFVIVLLVGCGRLSFDDRTSDARVGDGGTDSDPLADDDGDGVPNGDDLCVGDDAIDTNTNGVADACDPCIADPSCRDLGVPSGGYPSWRERAVLVGVNMVRSDPIAFRDQYMTFSDGTGAMVFATNPTPKPLVRYRLLGGQGARFHAQDRMACAFSMTNQGDLCDGTAFATWTQTYSPLSFVWLFYVSRPWARELPFYMVGAYVCGRVLLSGFAHAMCDADTNAPRQSIAFSNDGQLGPGWGADTAMTNFQLDMLWTAAAPANIYPVASAGHFFIPTKIVFALNYDVAQAPVATYVEIDGVRHPMTRTLGSDTRATMHVEQTPGTGCRSYHYLLVASDGMIWRYPGNGELRTYAEQGCTEDWIP